MDTKKQKVIKVLKRIGIALSIGFNVLFLIAIIVGISGIKNKSNNVQVSCAESEVVEVDSQVDKKLLSFDSNEYKVEFLYQDYYNVSLDYLADFLEPLTEGSPTNCGFITLSSFTSNSVYCGSRNGHKYLRWTYQTGPDPSLQVSFNYDGDYKFSVSYPVDYSGDFYITFANGEDYENFVQYFPSQKNINDGIFETLSDSVVAFIGSISSGITAMTSVFYDSTNSQLTTIGLLSVIVVAITLSYFLFRLIIGLIRMRG